MNDMSLVVSHESIRGSVRPYVGWSVGRSVTLSSAGRDNTASSFCHVYGLVPRQVSAHRKKRYDQRDQLIDEPTDGHNPI